MMRRRWALHALFVITTRVWADWFSPIARAPRAASSRSMGPEELSVPALVPQHRQLGIPNSRDARRAGTNAAKPSVTISASRARDDGVRSVRVHRQLSPEHHRLSAGGSSSERIEADGPGRRTRR